MCHALDTLLLQYEGEFGSVVDLITCGSQDLDIKPLGWGSSQLSSICFPEESMTGNTGNADDVQSHQ